MPIRLTDDDDNNKFERPNNNSNNNSNRFTRNDDDNSSSSNLADSAARNKGIIAVIGLLLFGFWKFPKTTIFILAVAAALFWFFGDQELLRSWGLKQ